MRVFARASLSCGVAMAVLGLALLASGLFTSLAMASPGEDPSSSEQMTLNLKSIGLDNNLALYGLQGTQSLTIPVQPGLAPSALNALVELPIGVRGGTFTVSQDDRTLSRVPLPVDFRAPVSVPLDGAQVVDNAVTVLVRSYLDPLEGYCLYDPTVPLRLSNASVSFTGVEAAPATIADFLPPVLQKLTLFIPASPSHAESDAAIRVATTVVAHYGKQNTVVTSGAVGRRTDGTTRTVAATGAPDRHSGGPQSGARARGW